MPHIPNSVAIGQAVDEIRQFFDFSNGGRPVRHLRILKIRNFNNGQS